MYFRPFAPKVMISIALVGLLNSEDSQYLDLLKCVTCYIQSQYYIHLQQSLERNEVALPVTVVDGDVPCGAH